MSKICVIGLGQGGAVAAIKLAQAGNDVTIFEQSSRDNVSYTWYDDIRFEVFDDCDIPAPDESCYTQKSKWLFVSPDEKNSLRVPPAKPMEEVSISRRGLALHLADLAIEAGATVNFETPVSSLLVESERVVGVCVGGEEARFDLVIDASGFNSPFRVEVPAKFGVQAQPGTNDVLKGWRAFFRRAEGSSTPDPESTLYIKHCNGVGISWCNLNDRGEVDVLIARIGSLTEADVEQALAALRAKHDILPEGEPESARFVDIGLRCPIGAMVADGYALVGDSAFMPMPLMGSGIESAMNAGKWLAKRIIKDNITDFTTANLWKYQRKFMDKLGADYVFVDVLKRWALNLDVSLINWLFGCGAVTNEDMALVSTDDDNPAKIGFGAILKKVFILLKKPSLIGQAIKWLLKGLSAKRVASHLPEHYDEAKVAAWRKRYDAVLQKLPF